MKFNYHLFCFTALFCLGFAQLIAQPGNTITYTDGLGTITLDYAGEINGRNAYESSGVSVGDVRISWSGIRWESRAIDSFNDLLGFSNYDVSPNPPNTATGNWQPGDFDPPSNISGSGTQDVVISFDASYAAVCVDGDPVTGLGGGLPTGGAYSGPGVTDDGNGMTFTFDPTSAGFGVHVIGYGGPGALVASPTIQVASPTVTFDPPGPFASDAGPQALTTGTPADGTYTGTGVVDNGDGTFSFDPSVGEGTYTVTYTVTDSDGCSGSASGDIIVEAATLTDDTCDGGTDINALFGQAEGEPQTSTIFSNVGYTADGDPDFGNECHFEGDAFQNTIWFTFTGDGNTYNLRSVECNATDYIDDGDTQVVLYAGACDALVAVVCDEDEDGGNAIFNINTNIPTEAGVTYQLAIDGFNGVDGEFCLEVTNLGAPATEGNVCDSANDINDLFGQAENEAQTSSQYNTLDYTAGDSDPTTGFECFEDNQPLTNTAWYTFTGDGNRYTLRSVACGTDDYADDLQVVVYTGACDDLTAVACNEDENFDTDEWNIFLEVDTEVGVTYTMMIDRFEGNFENQGNFCLEVTNLGSTNVTDIQETDIRVFPNPTSDVIFVENAEVQHVDVMNDLGQIVRSQAVGNDQLERIDLAGLAAGVYFLRLETQDGVYAARIVKE